MLALGEQFVAVGTPFQDVRVTRASLSNGNAQSVDWMSAGNDTQALRLETDPSVGMLTLHYEWTADEPALGK